MTSQPSQTAQGEQQQNEPAGESAPAKAGEKPGQPAPPPAAPTASPQPQQQGQPQGGQRGMGAGRGGPRVEGSGQSGGERRRFGSGEAVPAVVEEIVGRTGTRGGIIQVRARVLDGYDRNKILRRNVKGPIRLKDVLLLRETEIEARSLTQSKKGRKF